MTAIDVTQWHNTGANGRARAVWVRKVGHRAACIEVRAYRCLLDLWAEGREVVDSEPFEPDGANSALALAKAFADRFLDTGVQASEVWP